VLTYSVHMILKLFHCHVRGRRYPFVKDSIYDEASADVPGSISGSFDANKRLHRLCRILPRLKPVRLVDKGNSSAGTFNTGKERQCHREGVGQLDSPQRE
jgi:hypothetical protein